MANENQMNSPLIFKSVEDTLKALESGAHVDQKYLDHLARKSKGDHECEITFEGSDGDKLETLYKSCSKNPGHPTFIPVSDFKMEHLPRFYRREKIMKSIQYWAKLTVMILTRFVSRSRPDTYPDSEAPYPYSHIRGSRRVRRFGTGNIFGVALDEDSVQEEVCPCHICEKLEFENREKVFWTVLVETSKHVIYDASEAKRSIFECFYDSDSTRSETVKFLYGYGMNEKESKIEEDLCQVSCVTHDKELVERLKGMVADHSFTLVPQYKKGLGILISHPHGCSKKITIGHILQLTVPVGWDYPKDVAISCDDTMACRLPLFPWSTMPKSNSDPLLRVLLRPRNPQKLSNHPPSSSNHLDEDPKDFAPDPGTQFLLPLGTTFTLPKDTQFAFQFSRQNSDYFTFPPGTKLTLKDGQDMFFPPEAEFFCHMFSARVSYVSYTVDSCEGSSGAALLQDGGGGIICCTFTHSGKNNLMDGNRSGLQSYAVLPKSVLSGNHSNVPDSVSTPLMPQYVRFQFLGTQ